MNKTEQFEEKQQAMSNQELIELSKKELSKLCKTGGKSLKMTVPPMVTDTDMLLCELIRRYEVIVKAGEKAAKWLEDIKFD